MPRRARPHDLPLATGPGAADVEALAMAGERVCVVGGANSAGQGALHLPNSLSGVTLLIRGESLAVTMPGCLLTQLKATRHRSPASHPNCGRPRPRPPGSPHARGRPDRPA